LKLRTFLEDMGWVRRVEVRPRSGSVIIEFDPSIRIPDDFVGNLMTHLIANADRLHESQTPSPGAIAREPGAFPSPAPKESLLERRHRFAIFALGGVLVSNMLKRLIFGSSLANGPLSFAGVVSVTAAVMLWSRPSHNGSRHHRRVVPLLNLASLVAVAASESLTAVEILFVGHVGLWAEALSERRAARFVEASFPALPHTISVWEDGNLHLVPLSEVNPGHIVVVGPMEMVPVDGKVVAGQAVVEEAHLTGRAIPRVCRQGHRVFAGSRVLEGSLHVDAEKSPQESSLAQIRTLVLDGLAQRTHLERQAEVFSRRSLRLGAWATAATLIFTGEMRRAMTVFLVFSCPCAMVLAASSVVAAAVMALVRRGIYVRSGRVLEVFPSLDAVCFDKT